MAQKACGAGFLIQVEDTPGAGTFTSITAIRSNGLSINNEAIDITDKTAAHYRTLLDNCGVQSMTLSGEGAWDKDDAQLAKLHDAGISQTILRYKIISDQGDTYEGNFKVTAFERTGAYNDAETYTTTLESSGQVAYTAPA